jgi:hypothetical protein
MVTGYFVLVIVKPTTATIRVVARTMAANTRSVRVIRGSALPAEMVSYPPSGKISATNNRACEGEHTQNKVPTYDRRETIAGEADEPVFLFKYIKCLVTVGRSGIIVIPKYLS